MPYRFVIAALLGLAASGAQAAICELAIEANDAMAFNTAELELPAGCDQARLTLRHSGKLPAEAMGHNWVLTESTNFDALTAATASGEAADGYLPAGDARILARTPLIGGGQTTNVTFSIKLLRRGGDYTFFCSFPGHWSLMKGKLVVR